MMTIFSAEQKADFTTVVSYVYIDGIGTHCSNLNLRSVSASPELRESLNSIALSSSLVPVCSSLAFALACSLQQGTPRMLDGARPRFPQRPMREAGPPSHRLT